MWHFFMQLRWQIYRILTLHKVTTIQPKMDGGKSLKLSLDYFLAFTFYLAENNNLTNFDIFKVAIYINLPHSKRACDERISTGNGRR